MTFRVSQVGALVRGLALALAAGGQNASPPVFEPTVGPLRPPPAVARSAIRVVSFNVYHAREFLSLTESIRASKDLRQADLFLLQEVEDHSAEGSSRAAQLAAGLELNYVYAPAQQIPTGGTHGLAILSRFPLRDIEIIPLKRFNLHFNNRQRIAVAATVDIPGGPLRVYNLHLDTRLNPGERQEQLRPVVERALAGSIPRVIIAGDFNTNPFRWAGRILPISRSDQAGSIEKFMGERGFATEFARAGSTMSRGFTRFRLDSIYTRGVEVRAAGVERAARGSDHLPLWIELAWPFGARPSGP